MKAIRLLQILLALAAIAYLFLLHDMNEMNVVLPYLGAVPPALVILVALALGFLLGWLPPTLRLLAKRRELPRLRRRLADSEGHGVPAYAGSGETPVIPDREPPAPAQEYVKEDAYTEHENI